jgi:hypothetical protein
LQTRNNVGVKIQDIKKLINNTNTMKLLNKGIYILSFLLLSIPFACTEEEDDFSIIEGLSFTVHTISTDGTKTGVIPTTVPGDGRVVFTVDFGDPAAKADDDVFQTSGPMVTYKYPKESLTYTITVTASLEGKDDVSITKEHAVKFVVEKPTTPGSPIAGTWKLAPIAGAMGVGENKNDMGWWSNSVADVTTRACLFDDQYVFNADGSFQNVLGSETWLETWQGAAAEGCGAPVFPHDGTATATYEYNQSAGTIKLTGKGAFLGLAKATNEGQLAAPGDAPDEVTYEAELSADGNTLEIDIDYGSGWWSFTLAKEVPPAIEGTWKLAQKAGAMGVGENKNDMGWWSNSVADVTTRACLFDDEYIFNADGSFQNVLGSDTWLETWQGAAEGCGAAVFPHDGTATATYEYNESAGTITLSGKGAFLGLAKVTNEGELAAPGDAPDEVTYEAELSADGNTLEIDIDYGSGWWSFTLERE